MYRPFTSARLNLEKKEQENLCLLLFARKRQLSVAGAQEPGVTECNVKAKKKLRNSKPIDIHKGEVPSDQS